MKFNGSDAKAFVTGSPNKTIADTREIDISVAMSSIDVSTRDSQGWKEIIGGQRSWNASFSGVVDYTEGSNEAGVKSLLALEIARAAVGFLVGNPAIGSENYTGSGLITNIDIGTPYEGECEWTAEVEGSGPLVPSTVSA